jgi:hypothetical protein
MKKTIISMTSVIAGLALTLGLTLTSCQKGDTGPAGEKGAAGTNGTNGVANIQTTTITLNGSAWTFDSAENSYDATLTVPGITQSIMDKGTIQVFMGDATELVPLPIAFGLLQIHYSFSPGQVFLSLRLSDGSVPSSPGTEQFKVVIIPPAMMKPNVNYKNYDEIKAAYNLDN